MIAAAHLVGEAVQDPHFTAAYGGDSLSAEVDVRFALPVPLPLPAGVTLHAGLEAGYRRLGGTKITAELQESAVATWMWYAPVAVTAGPRADLGLLDIGAAVGPVWVPWASEVGTDLEAGTSGVKVGLAARADAILHVRELQTGLHGTDPRRPDVIVLLGVGARVHRLAAEEGDGLDMSAIRLSAGVGVELP